VQPFALAEPVRSEILLHEGATPIPSAGLALSPDGRQLAFFAATAADSTERLWIRSLESLQARPLLGSEVETAPSPFFLVA